jgi:glycosyltransferase involved in cell wall biosynthesis
MRAYDRVDQFHQSTDVGDAITAEMLSLRSQLRSMGYQSDVYAQRVGPGCESEIRRISQYRLARRQLMLWHFSIGVDCFEDLATASHDIAVVYHNITPPEFISEPLSNFYLHLGRQQLRELPELCSAALADSNFNRRELLEAGFSHAHVLPVWSDGRRFVPPASKAASRSGDWLFVGRLIPNKRQVDLVRAFASYQRSFDPSARLILVGNTTYSQYVEAIREEIIGQHLTGRVELLGKVDERELLEVMWSCGAYVSLSEHEGFGVPLLEAMAAGMAVFAVGSGAVAETMGGAGVLLADRDPHTVAGTVASVLADQARLERTLAAQASRVEYFETFDRTGVLDAVIDECSGGSRRLRVAVDGPSELAEVVSAQAGSAFEVRQAPVASRADSDWPRERPDVTVTTSVSRADSDLTSGVVGIYRPDSAGGLLRTLRGEEVHIGGVSGWRGALESLLAKAYRPRVSLFVPGGQGGEIGGWIRAQLASLGDLIDLDGEPLSPEEVAGGMSVADVLHVALDAGSLDPTGARRLLDVAMRSSGVVVSVHGGLLGSSNAWSEIADLLDRGADSVVTAGGDIHTALARAGVAACVVDDTTPLDVRADLYREAAATGTARRLASSAPRYAATRAPAVSRSA